VILASSFESGEGNPDHAVDGNPDTFWHSRWSSDEARPPHFLVIDYSRTLDIAGLIYTARSDGENGHVKDYKLYASLDGNDWGNPVASGRIDRDSSEETIRLAAPVRARYLKFVMLSGQHGEHYASVADLELVIPKH
jgi:beta-galactosidase